MSERSNSARGDDRRQDSAYLRIAWRLVRKPLAAAYFVAQPFIKPALRATVGRNDRLWRRLRSARDELVSESEFSGGLDLPMHRRLYTAAFSVVGPPVRFVLKKTAGRNRALWSRLQSAHIRLVQGAPPEPWTPDASSPAARSSIRSRPFGVNLAGYLTSEKGTGEAARSAAAMLTATNVPLALNNIIDVSSINREAPPGRLTNENPYAFNLIWINADQAVNFAFHKGRSYFEGRHNIGAWAWELLEFPREWLGRFDYFDEIWVPSDFVVKALSCVSPVPVIRMPHPIERAQMPPNGIRSRFGLGETDFVFLFMFDYHSVLERKNPLGLIEAFKHAFRPGEPATLVVKSSHADKRTIRMLRDAARGGKIIIRDEVLSRDEIGAFYSLCDCYVSLHRSEGFGLTPAEAMAAAKPVIATAYGGNMDFMNESNSYLVKYKLVELDRDYPPYEQGSFWAEPDLSHAAELMRFVYENQDEAREIGKRAQVFIERTLSPFIVGETMKARLLAIAPELGLPVDAPAGTAGATVPSAGRVTRAYTE